MLLNNGAVVVTVRFPQQSCVAKKLLLWCFGSLNSSCGSSLELGGSFQWQAVDNSSTIGSVQM